MKILKQKECIVLTWPARIILTLLFLFFSILILKFIPSFLSVNKPNNKQILVLDGQMPDFAVKEAIKIFAQGEYKYIVTTGGELKTGYFVAEYKSMAEFTAATFLELGFDKEKLKVIPGGEILRDRTYNSALSLKNWMKENGEEAHEIDVLTVGSHARRSRYLFQKAFNQEVNVGIISIEDPAYDQHRWWKSSVGARVIISEMIAYLYVKLFF